MTKNAKLKIIYHKHNINTKYLSIKWITFVNKYKFQKILRLFCQRGIKLGTKYLI